MGKWTEDQRAAERERQRAEAEVIRDKLFDRVDDLARVLLPDGYLVRGEWRHGSKGSKSIVLTGANKGLYRDFEHSDKAKNLIGAVAELVTNGNMREAFSWARAYLGMDGRLSQAAIEAAERKNAERRKATEADAARQVARNRRIATGLWHGSKPIEGTPADEYLRGRGIDLRRLARMPGALRYSDQIWCAQREGKFPAMVAGLWQIGNSKLAAAHRTYLGQVDGHWDKAQVADPRSTLGSWPGALIPIQRGEGDQRWTDIEEGELIAFGEGIEEALSIALVKPKWRVAALGYVGNYARACLPVWCHLMLCVNNDPEGSNAWKEIYGDPQSGKRGAVADLEAQGHVVTVLRPPADYKDWNDLLRGKKRG